MYIKNYPGENLMSSESMDSLKYPIGRFKPDEEYTSETINKYIKEIEEAPAALRKAIEGLTEEQLDTPYRPDGWTIRQVVHHLPDSHMNSYIRFKLALTETDPEIKPYNETEWAKLHDTFNTPAQVSLDLFDSLQHRWAILLKGMSKEDFKKRFFHPERGLVPLDRTVALYAWHGRHHIAHITSLRQRMNW